MKIQELNEEYLLNLLDRLQFETELRYLTYDQCENEKNQWCQPMYIIPYWNIVEKIKSFTSYFRELNVTFPFHDIYNQPFDLSTMFPADMIRIKEEELIFKNEKIIVEYSYII